ncbi:MAG: hypothetical protein C5B44_05625 [Acidobacteria bacterium]|nr:MAG: hypothetical protein C5B44_05625 [Acidobacteriota bacterium]
MTSVLSKVEAEKAILGAVLLDPVAYGEAAVTIRAEDFSLDSHRIIWARFSELIESGKPIDIITLADLMGSRRELETVGGVAYISSLLDGVPDKSNPRHYAKIIRSASMRRRFHSLITSSAARVEDASEPTDSLINSTLEGLWNLLANDTKPEAESLKELMPKVLDRMCLRRKRTKALMGISTGIPELDQVTNGLMPGELWVVGALPARGKTSLAIAMGCSAAIDGSPTALFSMEMDRYAIVERVLAGQTVFGASKIRDPRRLTEDEWVDLGDNAAQIAGLPLYIDDSTALTPRELVARARLYVRRFGVKLIAVDFLQLMDGPGRDERLRVSACVRALRALAKDEKVAVIALSQLSRPGDINARPTMLRLKESGDIEAFAHVVLLLYRPVDDQGNFTNCDELIIGKQREGATGNVPLVFDPTTLTFKGRYGR